MNDSFGQLIEPPAVGFTFGAPGWYVLGVAVLFVLLLFGWLMIRHYRRNRYRRDALAYVALHEANLTENPAGATYEMNMVMKRLAISLYGRSASASLRSGQWIALLNESIGKELFDTGDSALVSEALYNGQVSVDSARKFSAKARTWISDHRRTFKPATGGH